MFRKSFLTLTGVTILALLAVSPVYGAPSLALGSTASYALTGSLKAQQSCTADPIAYAYQACTGISTFTQYSVTILGQSKCSSAFECSYIPANLTVPQGSTVTWFNEGNATHTVTSNQTLDVGLPGFDSGTMFPGGIFQNTFTQIGTYHYYDSGFKFMKGIVIVTPAPPPPPPPSPMTVQVDLSGTIGWSVEGLSTSQANLNVSHSISVSVSPIPGISITPVTESGSFEQSINLSTRVESPSTATAIVESLSSSLLPALAGATLATGASGSIFQNMLSSQSNSPDYTTWWVNGPLSLGSPVQILHGWSSVTGSESLNLGTIGTRSAWIVTSQTNEKVNLSIPNPSNPLSSSSSNAIVSLKFLWSYDKSADLLLRNDNAASLTMHSETPTTVYTSTGPVSVTVTRDMSFSLDLALLLSSTSLSLPKSPARASTLMDVLSAMPWMPLGIAGLVAGLAAAVIIWFTRRTRGAVPPSSAPILTPAAPPATPS